MGIYLLSSRSFLRTFFCPLDQVSEKYSQRLTEMLLEKVLPFFPPLFFANLLANDLMLI